MRRASRTGRGGVVALGLFALSSFSPAAQAPDARLAAIREHSARVQSLIAEADKEAEGGGFSGL